MGEPPTADVSILIVAYKSRETLPRVIQAIDQQTVRPESVMVLENGSPDGQGIDGSNLPDWVGLHESPDNLGFAKGNNVLADGVRTAWLVFLNPDAYPESGWLEALMKASQSYPQASLLGSTQWAAGRDNTLDGVGDVWHAFGIPYRGGYGQPGPPPDDGEVFAPCAAAMMIKRDVFELLGGFDEDYFCYVEDVDLGYRARLMGQIAIQVRDAEVHHEGYASSGRRSEFATYHGTRNRLWTFLKDTPLVWLIILTPVHAGITLLLWLSAARFGLFTTFGRGLWDGLKAWSSIMDKRKIIHKRNKKSESLKLFWTWNPLHLLTRRPVFELLDQDESR